MVMKNKNSIVSGLFLALLGVSPVHAGLISVSKTLTFNQTLAGTQTTASFDFGALLAELNLTPAQIISGKLTSIGYSAPNLPEPFFFGQGYEHASPDFDITVGEYSDYVRTPGPTSYITKLCEVGCFPQFLPSTQYVRSRDVFLTDDVADTLEMTVGSTTVSDAADEDLSYLLVFDNLLSEPDEVIGCDRASSDPGDCIVYLSQSTEHYSTIYGGLEVVGDLDAFALSDIQADGKLQATIGAPLGQVRLSKVTLTLQVEDERSVAVPEPSSLGLFGIAGCAALLARRRSGSNIAQYS